MENFTSNKPYLLRAIHEWIEDNHGTPHLIVNADYPDVQVPREHVNNGEIVLNISSSAVVGLQIDNHQVMFNARFSGVARVIKVPIGAVLAIIARENSLGMAFNPEVPAESEQEDAAASSIDLVEGQSQQTEEIASSDEAAVPTSERSDKQSSSKPAKSKGSHLKLIK
ncbi:MAG: ClpXP protease specificity-enhancing factor [Kangiellaceae bacterium]|jgi:stringent starvation protein B|nr:ClpXP protease specificity-enhancing factor [Kangiellaceae bacterium]